MVPRDSSWFAYSDGSKMVELREQPLYKEDWLGLKRIDKAGGLLFESVPGEHMAITPEWFKEEVVEKYLSGTAQV